MTEQNSEIFFFKLNNILQEEIQLLKESEAPPQRETIQIFKMQRDKVTITLQLLQQLCENHNVALQNYIRNQENSRRNYDLVLQCVQQLSEEQKSMWEIRCSQIMQCYNTLTEFIQGPCYDNQIALVDSKFLEIASSILRFNEYDDKPLKLFEEAKLTQDLFYVQQKRKQIGDESQYISGKSLAHIKHACLITVLSLLEGVNDSYILAKMIRAFPLEIFKANLVNIHENFQFLYQKNEVDSQGFNENSISKEQENEDDDGKKDLNTEEKEKLLKKDITIIETGFFIYFLLRKFKEDENPLNKQIVEEIPEIEIKQKKKNVFFALDILDEIKDLGLDVFKEGLQMFSKNIKKITSLMYENQLKENPQIAKKQKFKDA